jgi:hypothetical protein
MIKLLPPGLHAVLGDSAGGIFTRVFFARDRLLIDQDVLSCGPTPPCTDLAAWSKLRSDFWTHLIPGESGEHVPSRFNLVENAKKLVDAERIHIWAATGVSEQLFVAFVVHLTKLVGGDLSRLALVQFDAIDRRRIVGLGELDEAQLGGAPEPVAMSAEVAKQYLDAWAAITSPTPELLAGFALTHPGASAWLKLAVRLMSRRYPDRSTGLVYWDHAMLSRVAARGPAVSHIIGYTMAETFAHGDLVGDLYLYGRLLALGSARNPQPLVTLKGDLQSMRNTEAELTPFGEEVLKGTASNYPANPIDDWAGGVRLSSAEGKLWFNEGGRLTPST